MDEKTFYTGQVRAEMRKGVSYMATISIEDNGQINETQCECAAGMGPTAHCKHVQVILLAVVDFSSGKQPNMELTCTEKIQSFHRPKRLHSGSPVKAADLDVHNKTESIRFDPRPEKYRNHPGYQDYVKKTSPSTMLQTLRTKCLCCRLCLLPTCMP